MVPTSQQRNEGWFFCFFGFLLLLLLLLFFWGGGGGESHNSLLTIPSPFPQVQGLDDNEGRLSLTLRPSDLKVADLQSEGAVAGILSTFQSYVSERCSILEEMKLTQDTTAAAHSLPALARAFVPSGRVTGHVISLANDSAMVGLEGGLRGKIVKASMHGEQCYNDGTSTLNGLPDRAAQQGGMPSVLGGGGGIPLSRASGLSLCNGSTSLVNGL